MKGGILAGWAQKSPKPWFHWISTLGTHQPSDVDDFNDTWPLRHGSDSRGEPAASYRCTGEFEESPVGVWEFGKLTDCFKGGYRIYIPIQLEKKKSSKFVNSWSTGLGNTKMSTDYVQKPPGHWSRGPREFTGHNHLKTLFFGPSDHEDRRPQLKNRAKNRVMLCYVEGVLFPNPIPSPHVSSGYEVINHYKICSFNLTVEGPVKLCKSLSLLVAWVLWCTLWRWAQYKASSWWQKCTLKFMFECFFYYKKKTIASIER